MSGFDVLVEVRGQPRCCGRHRRPQHPNRRPAWWADGTASRCAAVMAGIRLSLPAQRAALLRGEPCEPGRRAVRQLLPDVGRGPPGPRPGGPSDTPLASAAGISGGRGTW